MWNRTKKQPRLPKEEKGRGPPKDDIIDIDIDFGNGRKWQADVKDSLARIEWLLKRMEVKLMATSADIMAKVQAQVTIIESVKVLVEQLKAAAQNPAELQAIVDALDANNVALGVLANTGQQEVPPPVDPQQ